MLRIIIALGSIQVLAILVGMLRSKILAVFLGPAGIGVTSVIDQSVQLVAYVSALSLPYASVKFLSRAHSRDEVSFQSSFSGLAQLLALLSSIGAGLALAVVLLLPQLLSAQIHAFRFIVVPALAAIPFASLNGFFTSTLAAARRTRASAVVSLLSATSLAVGAVVGVHFGGVAGLYWGNLVSLLILGLLLTGYLRRSLHLKVLNRHVTIRQTLHDNPDVLSFSLVLYVTTFTTSLAYLVMRLAILRTGGMVEAGLLQSALTLSGALGLALSPANGLYLTPILNRDIPRTEKLAAAVEFQGKLTLLIGAVAMPIVLFPRLLLVALFSGSFVSVSSVVFVFVVAQCFLQLAGVYQAVLIGFDDLKVYGALTSAGFILLGAGAWLLAPRLGILGVALSFVLSSAVVLSLGAWRLVSVHQLSVPARMRWTMAYGIAGVSVAGAFGHLLDGPSAAEIAAKVVLGATYIALLLWFTSYRELRSFVQLRFPLAVRP